MSGPGFRLDRMATLHFYWPISRVLSQGNVNRIPILMYHTVHERSSDPRPYFETSVSPRVFAKQMRQLHSRGYSAVSLEEALQALGTGRDDRKRVVITFDDGYHDFYENAFPVLSELQFTATVFLMTGYMGDDVSPFKGRDCLTWKEVRELHSHGISFGSHTVKHPQLKFLTSDELTEELATSKKTIEDRLGAAVRSFSYPYAFPEADGTFIRLMRETMLSCGYENGVTTILGTANSRSDRFFLPRLPVNNWDDPRFFQAKLEGGYNWLHGAQYLSKFVEKLRSRRLPGKRQTVPASR